MGQATERQENFIREIAIALAIDEPMHLSKQEASWWISDHIEAYDTKLENDELASSTLSDEYDDWM